MNNSIKEIYQLKNELKLQIEINEILHKSLEQRPLTVDINCELISYDGFKEKQELMKLLIDSGTEFYVNCKKGNEILTIRPFNVDKNYNFIGLIVNVENKKEIKVYSLCKFGSYDVYEKANEIIEY